MNLSDLRVETKRLEEYPREEKKTEFTCPYGYVTADDINNDPDGPHNCSKCDSRFYVQYRLVDGKSCRSAAIWCKLSDKACKKKIMEEMRSGKLL